MIKNYLTITFRHLWRNRLFTGLNILGLSIAISVGWTIVRITVYEFSFDQNIPLAGRSYRIVSSTTLDGKEYKSIGVHKPIMEAIRQEIPSVELTVPLFPNESTEQTVSIADRSIVKKAKSTELQWATDGSYFKMVPYKWLAGSSDAALNGRDHIILTQSRANEYFPGRKPFEIIGKTLIFEDTIRKVISGIVADIAVPTSFKGREFISYLSIDEETRRLWLGISKDGVYITLRPGTSGEKVLQHINRILQKNKLAQLDVRYDLVPLPELHFSSEYSTSATNKSALYGLAGIGFFILLLACINFINLATAQIPNRSREIGIRKTLGSPSSFLISHFLAETLIITIASALVGLVLSDQLQIWLSEFMPDGINEHTNYTQLILLLAGMIVFVTAVSGIYPAWLSSKPGIISIIQNHSSNSKQGIGLRKGLIIGQFIVAQVFICGALITNRQLHYMLEQNLGFNKEAILLAEGPWSDAPEAGNRNEVLKNEILKIAGVEKVALGTAPMHSRTEISIANRKLPNGEIRERHVVVPVMDTSLINLYGIRVLTGSGTIRSDSAECIINETAVAELGFSSPSEALGQQILISQSKGYRIVGVVQNYHNRSYHDKISPVVIRGSKFRRGADFNIKLNGSPKSWENSIQKIELLWKKSFGGEDFKYAFFDQTIADLYKKERSSIKLINLATGIAILISCLGLFGLSTLTTYQRSKEISIRKLLGATVTQIVALLSADFVKLVVLALIISAPVAWYLLDQWLSNFSYRIDIQWWIFGIVGCLATLTALATIGFQTIRAALANPATSLKQG